MDYGDAIFEALGKPWVADDWLYTSGHNAVAFLCLLQGCEMDVLPPKALIRSMPTWHIPRNRLCHVPSGLFRAAWKMCIVGEYTGTSIDTIIESRIIPVCQWYFDTMQHATPDSNLLKAGWAALEKRHLESLPVSPTVAPKALKNNIANWITPVMKAEIDNFCFSALRSSSDLQVEGQEMQHCIATYSERCKTSSLRAFSIRKRKTDERIGTLTVFYSLHSRSWQLDQIKGPGNSDVNERAIQASLSLLHFLDEATRSDMTLQSVMTQLGGTQYIDGRRVFDFDCCIPF